MPSHSIEQVSFFFGTAVNLYVDLFAQAVMVPPIAHLDSQGAARPRLTIFQDVVPLGPLARLNPITTIQVLQLLGMIFLQQ